MIKDILMTLIVNVAVFSLMFLLMLAVRRLFGKRISPTLQLVLWTFVVIKLIIPYGFESDLDIFTANEMALTPAVITQNSDVAMPASTNTDTVSEIEMPQKQSAGVNLQPVQSLPDKEVTLSAATKPIDWWMIVFGAWATGVLAVGLVLGLGGAHIRRSIRRTRFIAPKRVIHVFEECKALLGVKRHVDVCVQSTYGTPSVMGVIKPCLILPETALSTDSETLRHIMVHELCHLKRSDLIRISALNLLCAVYWFNPLMWLSVRLIRADIETACDHSVFKTVGHRGRLKYIETLLQFTGKTDQRRWAAAMALSHSASMEKRIKGMFKPTKTKMAGRCAALVLVLLMLSASVLTACQPTPDKSAVVGRDEDKITEAMVQPSGEDAQPYDAPEHLDLTIGDLPNNFSIVFNADVVVPDQAQWPAYTVKTPHVTQEQADTVREVLLEGATLYKPSQYRSREEIQYSIDQYESELKAASEGGLNDLVEPYKEILKKLYAEYENTPEDIKFEEADLKFAYMENSSMGLNGGSLAGTEAAGGEAIFGVCWMQNGRKMQFSAINGENGGRIAFRGADVETRKASGVSFSVDEAKEKADALLQKMGLDFVFVDSSTREKCLFTEEKDGSIKTSEDGNESYTLIYKRRIDGVPQDNIVSRFDQNIGDDYRGAVPEQETIIIILDDYGVNSFFWNPMEVSTQDSANVKLMPFDEVTDRIAQQLKVQTMWDEQADYEKNHIVSRRLEINRVQLSYLLINKQNDMNSYYLIPVWNVCGDMYYRYRDDYGTGDGNSWVLDENNERNPWRAGYDNRNCVFSCLTINALDGSVIPRLGGYSLNHMDGSQMHRMTPSLMP